MASIFVQIACYHDLELPETIKDLLEKCSEDNFIHFGVHNCFYDINPLDEFELRKELDQLNKNYKLSITHSRFPENIGVGTGRYIANSFYDNEDYYMQIDSHTFVIYQWDKLLISYIEKAKKDGIKKPLISSPLNSYSVDKDGKRVVKQQEAAEFLYNKDVNIESLLAKKALRLQPFKLFDLKQRNEVSRVFETAFNCFLSYEKLNNLFEYIYVTGCFIFSTGDLSKVKPNRNIFYFGDEFLTSCRIYTHGYTVLRADYSFVAFHLTRSKTGKPGDDWIIDRRREPHEDLPNYFTEKEDGQLIFNQLWDNNINELRKIIALRTKSNQAFGHERDFEQIIDSLFD